MTISEIIALIALSMTIFVMFIKLNVKIAEINKDQLSIRKDFEDHKKDNDKDLSDMSLEMGVYRQENREDHLRILKSLEENAKIMTDLRIHFSGLTQINK
ncbi:MAG TPA: hypothetical protein VIK86_01240 [Candidatus Paceibacterota bacterium]